MPFHHSLNYQVVKFEPFLPSFASVFIHIENPVEFIIHPFDVGSEAIVVGIDKASNVFHGMDYRCVVEHEIKPYPCIAHVCISPE